MSVESCIGRTFKVTDSDARIREDDLRTFATWKAGEARPLGVAPGKPKVIPKGTDVRVTAVRVDGKKRAFALVESAAPAPSGWTAASNLEGGLVGETIGLLPNIWLAKPDGERFTVTDPQALGRGGAPDYKPTGALLPVGTYVRVEERSPGGSYLSVLEAGGGTRLGWTAASNLAPGWSEHFDDPSWLDPKGPNACWERGKYLGPRVLVQIVGVGDEVECLTYDALGPWLDLRNAARKDGVELELESGFRTWHAQAALYAGYKANQPGFNKAAPAGHSNHQNGLALDLNTGGFETPAYQWLAANATSFGFVRTVSKEHWHWEYRPAEAEALKAKGRCARDGVVP